MVQPKNIQCTVFTAIYRLSTYKITSFQTLSLGYILKIFLKFHKFEPQYSYKICSHRKKKRVYFVWNRVWFSRKLREVMNVACENIPFSSLFAHGDFEFHMIPNE